MITTILRTATRRQIEDAIFWTSDNLHVPWNLISPEVAIAYTVKHFAAGSLTGWDGFITDMGYTR